jgi:hypothetical protein
MFFIVANFQERERGRVCDPRLNFAVRRGTESSFKGVSTTIATL